MRLEIRRPMLKVGLTGGSGQREIFRRHALADLGCLLIQADELGHQVIEPGAEAYQAVIDEFGSEILSPDSTIDRRALAAKVFSNPERLDNSTPWSILRYAREARLCSTISQQPIPWHRRH